MSEWYDRKWILSRLPHDIPQDIVDHAFDGMGQYYVKKDPLEVWCIREREADHVVERFAHFWHPKTMTVGRSFRWVLRDFYTNSIFGVNRYIVPFFFRQISYFSFKPFP